MSFISVSQPPTLENVQDLIGPAFADSASVDFTYNDGADTISAAVLPAGVDHNSLANIATGDVHTQYGLLAGRSGGQSLVGGTAAGNHLNLESTSNASKGDVRIITGSNLICSVDAGSTIGEEGASRFSKAFISTQVQVGTAFSGLAVNAISLGQDATKYTLFEYDTGTSSMTWIVSDTTTFWGFRSNPATEVGTFHFCSSTNGNVIDFVDNSASGRILLRGASPSVLSNTDGAGSIGAAGATRFDKAYLKSSVIVGTDQGASGVFQAANDAGTAGTISGMLSGTVARHVFNDLATGQWGWYADCASPSNMEYRIVGGAVPFRLNSDQQVELLGSTAPASTADKVMLSGHDISAGNRTLALSTETAVAADIANASTHSLIVRINGTNYKILLSTTGV